MGLNQVTLSNTAIYGTAIHRGNLESGYIEEHYSKGIILLR